MQGEKSSGKVVINIRDVSFSYNSTPTLDRVNISIGEGEFTALIGPNGSGKTTLLKLMCRVLTPKKGVIMLKGENLKEFNPKEIAKLIAYAPPGIPDPPGLTAFEVVLLGRYPWLKGSWWEGETDEKVAVESLKILGVLNLGDRLFSTLSSGEKQRVLLAKALAQETEILLIDEPVAYLDLKYQLEVMELLRKLSREGKTIIAAMHQVNLATQYCDKVIVLNRGRIVAAGKPEEVLTEQLIQEVYGVKALVRREGGRVFIVPLSPV